MIYLNETYTDEAGNQIVKRTDQDSGEVTFHATFMHAFMVQTPQGPQQVNIPTPMQLNAVGLIDAFADLTRAGEEAKAVAENKLKSDIKKAQAQQMTNRLLQGITPTNGHVPHQLRLQGK